MQQQRGSNIVECYKVERSKVASCVGNVAGVDRALSCEKGAKSVAAVSLSGVDFILKTSNLEIWQHWERL